jgi:hypothetical protein
VEILARTRALDFGPFTAEGRDEPRRGGHAYVWARSAATSADLLASGQHTGVAAQAAEGRVSLAVVFIGGNDFLDWLASPAATETAEDVAARACANVDEAVRVLLAASPVLKIVLVTVPELSELPEIAGLCREGQIAGSRLEASRRGLARFNAHLLAWPRREARVSAADFAGMSRLGAIVAPEAIPVGPVRVRRNATGLGREAAFLPDGRHAGTLLQGVLAQVILQSIDRQLQPPLPPLAGTEIVAVADAIATEASPEPLTTHAASAASSAGSGN